MGKIIVIVALMWLAWMALTSFQEKQRVCLVENDPSKSYKPSVVEGTIW